MGVSATHLRVWGRGLLVAMGIGAFVGVTGPFGSFQNGGVGVRIAYWAAMIAAGMGIYRASIAAGRWAARRFRLPGLMMVAIAALAATVPMALLSRSVALALWPFLGPRITPLDWYGQCLILSLPLAGGFELLARRRAAKAPVPTVPPARFGRDVICLQMEDHYVRAHTTQGSILHLMTLSEAVARAVRPGLQVHRSWWVALDSVQAVVRDGRRIRLKLLNGLEVPVARRSVARLKAAGLAPD